MSPRKTKPKPDAARKTASPVPAPFRAVASSSKRRRLRLSGNSGVAAKPTRRLPLSATPAFPVRQDALQRYIAEAARYPLLTLEEEGRIARHYRQYHDRESAHRLVLSNLRLVVKIVMEYRGVYDNILDLIQEGNMGLLRAVDKYDVDKSVRFSSYAVWWVRAFILKFLIENYRLVKIGTTQAQKKLFYNLMREKERIEKLGFTPTPKLLSEKLNVTENEVREMEIRMGSREIELDAPKPHFDDARNVDFIAAETGDTEKAVEDFELKDILLKNLDEFTRTLKEKERRIFSERLFAEIPRTLQEIADEYGITRERIRQVETRVIGKMRDFFTQKGIAIGVKAEKNNAS